MPHSIGRLSISASSHHSLSLAAFIINTAEADFRYTQASQAAAELTPEPPVAPLSAAVVAGKSKLVRCSSCRAHSTVQQQQLRAAWSGKDRRSERPSWVVAPPALGGFHHRFCKMYFSVHTGEPPMDMLSYRCPATSKEIRTGIDTDPAGPGR